MRICIVGGLAIVAFGLTSRQVRADAAATNEILRVVPASMAGCVIVEDLRGYCDRLSRSPFWRKAAQTPIIASTLERPEVRAALGMRAMLPAIVGASFEELRDQILGSSVVLAFRPGQNDGETDIGIAYCRVADAKLRQRLLKSLTAGRAGQTADSLQYRGYTYYRKTSEQKREFLVELDNVIALTDKEQAIHETINARLSGSSLATARPFLGASEHLPQGCLVRAFVDPRSFDGRMEAACRRGTSDFERENGETLLQMWKSVQWAALTLKVDEHVEFGCHASIDVPALPSDLRAWLRRESKPAEVWRLAPSNAMLAATCEVDFADLGRTVEGLLKASEDPGARALANSLGQLVPGYDLLTQVMPKLGPELAVIVSPRRTKSTGAADVAPSTGRPPASKDEEASLLPHLVAMVRVNPTPTPAPGWNAFHEALESGIRPFFVLAAIDHNKKTGDRMEAKMALANGARVHVLSGSQMLPAGLEPAFSSTPDWLIFGSSAQAIRELATEPLDSLAESAAFKAFGQALPKGTVLAFYMNVRQMRESINAAHVRLRVQTASGEAAQNAATFETTASLLSLFDAVVAGERRDNGVFHWIAVLIPEKDASFRPAD